MDLHFTKMHGLGNDFVVLDRRTQAFEPTPNLMQSLADRRFGVGCDQVVVLETANEGDILMRIFNPDGTEAGTCGNAARCVAGLVMEERGKTAITIQTNCRLLRAENTGAGIIRVDMGTPSFNNADIPLKEGLDSLNFKVLPKLPLATALSMGNPHAVFFVENLENIDVAELGPQVEKSPLFPAKTNVEFVQVTSHRSLTMQVWERGTGITQACGSGACAAVAAGVRHGLVTTPCTVTMSGGTLEISMDEAGHMRMAGPWAKTFSGTFAYVTSAAQQAA